MLACGQESRAADICHGAALREPSESLRPELQLVARALGPLQASLSGRLLHLCGAKLKDAAKGARWQPLPLWLETFRNVERD